MPFSLPSSSNQKFLHKSKTAAPSSSLATATTSSSKTKSPSSLFSFKAAAEKASDRFRSKKPKEAKKAALNSPLTLEENFINDIVKIEAKPNKLVDNTMQTKSTSLVSSLDKKAKLKSISKIKIKKAEIVNSRKASKKSGSKKDSVESSGGSCVSSISSSNNTNSISTTKSKKAKSKRINLLAAKIDEEESDSHQETEEIKSNSLSKKKLNKKVKSDDEYNFNDEYVGTNEDEDILGEEDASDRDMFEESYADQIIEEEEVEDEDNLANGKYLLFN